MGKIAKKYDKMRRAQLSSSGGLDIAPDCQAVVLRLLEHASFCSEMPHEIGRMQQVLFSHACPSKLEQLKQVHAEGLWFRWGLW